MQVVVITYLSRSSSTVIYLYRQTTRQFSFLLGKPGWISSSSVLEKCGFSGPPQLYKGWAVDMCLVWNLPPIITHPRVDSFMRGNSGKGAPSTQSWHRRPSFSQYPHDSDAIHGVRNARFPNNHCHNFFFSETRSVLNMEVGYHVQAI